MLSSRLLAVLVYENSARDETGIKCQINTTLTYRSWACVYVTKQGAGPQVRFKALHDLPAGEEFTQSYFPMHTSYPVRQQRCQEQYGFTCTCPRCKVNSLHPAPKSSPVSMGVRSYIWLTEGFLVEFG